MSKTMTPCEIASATSAIWTLGNVSISITDFWALGASDGSRAAVWAGRRGIMARRTNAALAAPAIVTKNGPAESTNPMLSARLRIGSSKAGPSTDPIVPAQIIQLIAEARSGGG